ncbi:MAG: hypothetical protein RLZZ241_654 [Bacteroidota bacterium]
MKLNIGAILLTGGLSSRMGQPKALLPWGTSNVLEHLIKTIKDAGITQLTIVTGAHHKAIAQGSQKTAPYLCYNSNWERGMGTSIHAGVVDLFHRFQALDAILILLIDQPLITAVYLEQMLKQFEKGRYNLIASRYNNNLGAPALFGKTYFKSLQNLPENEGAKALIRNTTSKIFICDAALIGADMDTLEAYYRLKKNFDQSL